jgi:hypothetical protein
MSDGHGLRPCSGASLPRYGERSLADVLPSVAAGLGVEGFTDVLGLGVHNRACVALIDGLGWNLLRRHADVAPFLSGLLAGAEPLTAGFPTTTATSMGSLGTGLPPGAHGLLGYEVAAPGADGVLNLLTWRPDVDPMTYQPAPTVFERAAAAGVAMSQVGPSIFEGSPLTTAALRGGRFVAADSLGERIAAAAAPLRGGDAVTSYVYYGDLDATGHRRGCTSEAWQAELATVDHFIEQLAGRLPSGSTLMVTADHGMVDVAPEDRVDIAHEPELAAGVRLVAGEPRARYVYTRTGAAEDVLAAWRERLGDRMHVMSATRRWRRGGSVRCDLSTPSASVTSSPWRAARAPVVDSRSMDAGSLALLGQHGALTDDELLVPLLLVRT